MSVSQYAYKNRKAVKLYSEPRSSKEQRAAIIEECALEMERIAAYGFRHGRRIDAAAAIRGLKDKP